MYSQYHEDDLFLDLLPAKGRALDIGAWDPMTFSNSRALIERGWSAVLIEPSPTPLSNLIHFYWDNREVQVVNSAVTVEGGMIRLAVTDDAVTQQEGPRIGEWLATGGFYGHMSIPALSVVQLFEYFGGDFDFVSIDTEGTSVDVFAEMCRLGPRPLVVIVEHDNRFVECSNIAQAANYRLLHENGTNRVYEWTGKREK